MANLTPPKSSQKYSWKIHGIQVSIDLGLF